MMKGGHGSHAPHIPFLTAHEQQTQGKGCHRTHIPEDTTEAITGASTSRDHEDAVQTSNRGSIPYGSVEAIDERIGVIKK